MINKVILLGNVGQDPEVKHLDGGKVVANFSLATSESYKHQSGEKITTTEWHNCVAWEALARVIEQYVKKGDKVYVEGKIYTEAYKNADGADVKVKKIRVKELKMLSGKQDGSQQQTYQPSQQKQSKPTYEPVDLGDHTEDDLPF